MIITLALILLMLYALGALLVVVLVVLGLITYFFFGEPREDESNWYL